MTLTEFLTARLDEWEASAVAVHEDRPVVGYSNAAHQVSMLSDPLRTFVLDNGPNFVLAQVSTYRTIMALHQPDDPRDSRCVTCFFETEDDMPEGWVTSHVPEYWPCDTLRALAHPWINHPDYRTEWA